MRKDPQSPWRRLRPRRSCSRLPLAPSGRSPSLARRSSPSAPPLPASPAPSSPASAGEAEGLAHELDPLASAVCSAGQAASAAGHPGSVWQPCRSPLGTVRTSSRRRRLSRRWARMDWTRHVGAQVEVPVRRIDLSASDVLGPKQQSERGWYERRHVDVRLRVVVTSVGRLTHAEQRRRRRTKESLHRTLFLPTRPEDTQKRIAGPASFSRRLARSARERGELRSQRFIRMSRSGCEVVGAGAPFDDCVGDRLSVRSMPPATPAYGPGARGDAGRRRPRGQAASCATDVDAGVRRMDPAPRGTGRIRPSRGGTFEAHPGRSRCRRRAREASSRARGPLRERRRRSGSIRCEWRSGSATAGEERERWERADGRRPAPGARGAGARGTRRRLCRGPQRRATRRRRSRTRLELLLPARLLLHPGRRARLLRLLGLRAHGGDRSLRRDPTRAPDAGLGSGSSSGTRSSMFPVSDGRRAPQARHRRHQPTRGERGLSLGERLARRRIHRLRALLRGSPSRMCRA